MTDSNNNSPPQKSWLNKLTFALTGKPKDLDDFIKLIHDAAKRELIDDDILHMFEGVLKIQQLKVKDAIIPRSQMITIANDMLFNEIVSTVVKSGHSRFPITGENKDEILGILLAKDLLAYSATKDAASFKIENITRDTLFIPESKRLGSLLREFQYQRSHLAIVVDEYGGITGLITIEDVIEQIVGEIEDEYDIDEESLIRKTSNNTYAIKALTPIEDFNKFFEAELDSKDAETIGGLVMRELGRLPKLGEIIAIDNFNFKILRADNRRIHLLQVVHTAK